MPYNNREERKEVKKTRIAFLQRDWEDNLGILWISAVLRKHDFETGIWVESKHSYRDLLRFSPEAVCYSCITGSQKWIYSSINKIKLSGIKTKFIVGGPHVTFYPEFINNSFISAICLGEGEDAMLEYAQALEDGKEPYGIKNFYFNRSGEIIKNEPRPFIGDLDSLPFPDRSYYKKYKFLATNPYKIFITSRGCPFDCTFCFNHTLKKLYGPASLYVRRHSAGYVIEELLQVRQQWGIDEVRFSDDHFALDARWLKDFTNAYQKEINRPYSINARVDVLDEERIYMLKNSGCRLVCFGIETGREDLRNQILKKDILDEQIIQTAELLKKYKIKFLASNIIGLPNETTNDAWKTIEINQKIHTDLPWFSMMQYYPGTEIYLCAKQQGLLSDKYNLDQDQGGYFKNNYLQQKNIGELRNIHSFSILASRYKGFVPVFKFLSARFKPNPFFGLIFKLSYLGLTLKRAHISIWRILRWGRFYFAGISKQ